jgi:hypothetical protein
VLSQRQAVIPLLSEFLQYEEGGGEPRKQDCESKAFHRLAARIKKAFARLPILFLLHGLYPNGPIMERCREYHWDFMIVLKDGSLPTVWEEHHSRRHEQDENRCQQDWDERRQHFQWVNAIRYEYGPNAKKAIDIHVVVCREEWEEVDLSTQPTGVVLPSVVFPACAAKKHQKGATMMPVMPFGALSLGTVGWVLLGLTFMNLGSGAMEERTCQAACLQAYFFSASAASGIGLILGILGLTKPDFRGVTYLALVLLIPLCFLIGGLILIGNLG